MTITPSLRLLALLSLMGFVSLAQAQSGDQVITILGNSVPGGTAVTVALGCFDSGGRETVQAIYPVPRPPVTVSPGDALTITTGYDETTIQSVKWTKDGVVLASTASTLSFAHTGESDSGFYAALVTIGGAVKPTDGIRIRVFSPPRQQLLNLSARTTINPANPRLIAGFVIAHSLGQLNESKRLLIRAIGPTLASQGVDHPLTHPVLRVFRANGTEVSLDNSGYVVPNIAFLAQVTGAFPLAVDSGDVALAVTLPAGIYSAHVSSADGGTGDVLLEIYEIPAPYDEMTSFDIATPAGPSSSRSPGN